MPAAIALLLVSHLACAGEVPLSGEWAWMGDGALEFAITTVDHPLRGQAQLNLSYTDARQGRHYTFQDVPLTVAVATTEDGKIAFAYSLAAEVASEEDPSFRVSALMVTMSNGSYAAASDQMSGRYRAVQTFRDTANGETRTRAEDGAFSMHRIKRGVAVKLSTPTDQLHHGDNFHMEASVIPGAFAGNAAEYWLFAVLPDGTLFGFDAESGAWSAAADRDQLAPSATGPLKSISDFTVVDCADLPVGQTSFVFGIDLTPDGALEETGFFEVQVVTVHDSE
jgi:hypothetical protein